MALRIEQYVLRFEISVNYPMLVQVLKCKDDLCSVKSCPILTKSNLVTKMIEKFSAIKKVTHKVQLFRVLECEMELDDEGVIDHLHDVSFNLRVTHLLSADNLIFFQRFHCIDHSI